MNKRVIGTLSLIVLCLIATGLTVRAQTGASEKPTGYTYVAQWAVPRAQWPDASKFFEQDRAAIDKFVTDGTLTGFGTFENVIHSDGGPTHGLWLSSTSISGILKTLDALTSQPPNPLGAVLNNAKHWDEILESDTYAGHSGSFKGAYLDGSFYQVKPGRGREFRELWKATFLPILDKLLADGVIHSYSLNAEAYHSSKPGGFSMVYIAADAAALDKVGAAFDAALSKNESLGPAMRNLTETEDHRDFLIRITGMRAK